MNNRIALENEQEKKRKLIAVIATIVFHGLLMLCFFFMGLKHQIPPPPEYGIEVDMGGGGGGGGSNAQIASTVNAVRPTASARENISTQDAEETVGVNASRNPVRQQPTTSQVTPTETPQPVPETPTVNPNALFNRRTAQSGGSGGGTGGGTGSGTGTGVGSGSGTGTGSGHGSGAGNSGGDFFLNGRPVVTKAFPRAKNNLEGVVKVEFRADRDGNVIYAKAGGRGTTINDSQIWEECEKAAMRSKFRSKSDAQVEEKGVITYQFVMQ